MKALTRKKNQLRFLSLSVALLIWMYVVSSAEIEVTKNIPINIEVPEKYAIANRWDQEVQYRIKGPGLFVRKFLEKNLSMQFKQSDYYQKGRVNYKLVFDRSKVKLPLGVELVDIQPRVLNLALEKSMTKLVKVKIIEPEGFREKNQIESMVVDPKAISVTGPRSVVRNLDFIETPVLDSKKLNPEKNFVLSIKSQDPRIKLKNELVNISYELKAKTKEFTFSDLPIIFQTVSLISQVEPKVVSVVLEGDSQLIDELKKEDIKVIADVPSGAKGKTEVKLKVDLRGKDLKVLNIFPPTVKLVLE